MAEVVRAKRQLAGAVVAIAEASHGRDLGVGEGPPSSGGEGTDPRRPRAAHSRPYRGIVLIVAVVIVQRIEVVDLLLGAPRGGGLAPPREISPCQFLPSQVTGRIVLGGTDRVGVDLLGPRWVRDVLLSTGETPPNRCD